MRLGPSRAANEVMYENEIRRHNAAVQEDTQKIEVAYQAAAEAIRGILAYEHGWMRDAPQDSTRGPTGHPEVFAEADPRFEGAGRGRAAELGRARRQWIPLMAGMLHDVYFRTATWILSHGRESDLDAAINLYKNALQVGVREGCGNSQRERERERDTQRDTERHRETGVNTHTGVGRFRFAPTCANLSCTHRLVPAARL